VEHGTLDGWPMTEAANGGSGIEPDAKSALSKEPNLAMDEPLEDYNALCQAVGLESLSSQHPVRIALDAIAREGRTRLLSQLMFPRVGNEPARPDSAELRGLLRGENRRRLADYVTNHLWGFFDAPPPPPISLRIDRIDAPPVWAYGQQIRVYFSLDNGSEVPTSGLIHGTATQAVWQLLASSRWFRPGSVVANVLPHQSYSGILDLTVNSTDSRAANAMDVDLTYWIEDPSGTITFIEGLPGEQQDRTFAVLAVANGSLSVPIGFARDIRPLFRDKDVQAMRFAFDLSSYQDVKEHASAIYNAVAHPTPAFQMPCDRRWPTTWVATFKLWMDEGFLP
jgi:hypothetical protein